MHDDALKQELLRESDEFRILHDEHQGLEQRLDHLYQQSMLSEEDELELKRIKRQKLRLKDRMNGLMRAHEQAHVSA